MSEITEEEIATIIRSAMLSDPQHGTFTERMEQRTVVCSEATRAVLALLQPALERARREERERCAVIAEAVNFGPPEGGAISAEYRDGYSDGTDVAQAFIAAAIRKG